MSAPPFTSPEPADSPVPSALPARRPPLGPRGLLSRRGTVPGTDGDSHRPAPRTQPGGTAPAPPGVPLPPGLLPLPPGFELNRGPARSVVPT